MYHLAHTGLTAKSKPLYLCVDANFYLNALQYKPEDVLEVCWTEDVEKAMVFTESARVTQIIDQAGLVMGRVDPNMYYVTTMEARSGKKKVTPPGYVPVVLELEEEIVNNAKSMLGLNDEELRAKIVEIIEEELRNLEGDEAEAPTDETSEEIVEVLTEQEENKD